MSYAFYKIIHLSAIFAVFLALGGIAHHMLVGGTKEGASRKLLGLTHGIALLLVFVSGFGLMARLGLKFSESHWLFAKLAIWLVFGASTAVLYKKGGMAKVWWLVMLVLGALAAYLAQTKPF